MDAIRFRSRARPWGEPGGGRRVVVERSYTACEIDIEGGFWMDPEYAERLGDSAPESSLGVMVSREEVRRG